MIVTVWVGEDLWGEKLCDAEPRVRGVNPLGGSGECIGRDVSDHGVAAVHILALNHARGVCRVRGVCGVVYVCVCTVRVDVRMRG
jgi:hypothetical protein